MTTHRWRALLIGAAGGVVGGMFGSAFLGGLLGLAFAGVGTIRNGGDCMLWNVTKAGALVSAMKLIDRNVDPDLLLKRADELGVKLPITSAVNVSAASLPGGGIARIAFKVDAGDIYKLRDAIDAIMARKAA